MKDCTISYFIDRNFKIYHLPPIDIQGIHEPISGFLFYGNNIISGAMGNIMRWCMVIQRWSLWANCSALLTWCSLLHGAWGGTEFLFGYVFLDYCCIFISCCGSYYYFLDLSNQSRKCFFGWDAFINLCIILSGNKFKTEWYLMGEIF